MAVLGFGRWFTPMVMMVGGIALLAAIVIERRNTRAWIDGEGVHQTRGLIKTTSSLAKDGIDHIEVTFPVGGRTSGAGTVRFVAADAEWAFHGVVDAAQIAQAGRTLLGVAD